VRGLGVWLVGLGITLLVMCVFPIAAAETPRALVGWLACAGLVPGSLIVLGIILVRRAEDRARTADTPQDESLVAPVPEPAGILDRVRAFDLNRLNWAGWLLLLATFGFVLAEVAVLVWMWPDGGDRRLPKLVATVMLFLAVGFFVASRWVLARLGVSIYRHENRGSEPDAASDHDS